VVAVESRPFVFPREWPSVRNSLVAHERHSRTRVCRHEVSNRKGTGLGARDLCVCTGADRGCTCQRKFGSRTFDCSEDCGKGTDPVDLSENASRILCQNIHWNSSAVESITQKRHLRAAAVGRRTGRRYRASGQRPKECLHTACDGSRHAPTAAGHMRQGTTAGIRKRNGLRGWHRAPRQKRVTNPRGRSTLPS